MANKGFTLIEMMITVAIAALLLTIAVPSFEGFITNNRLSTQANAFVGALQFARSEAIKRNLSVAVCRSRDGLSCSNRGGFEQGWIVFVDSDDSNTFDNGEAIIKINQGMSRGMSMSSNRAVIRYRADGTLDVFNNITLRLCKQGNSQRRDIVINITGRVIVTVRNDCPIN